MLRLPRRQVIATLVMRPFPPIIVVRWLIIVSYRIGTFTFTFSCVPTYVGSCTVAVGGVNDGGVAQHEGSKEGEGGATVAPFVTGDGAPRNPRLAAPYASLPQLATAAPRQRRLVLKRATASARYLEEGMGRRLPEKEAATRCDRHHCRCGSIAGGWEVSGAQLLFRGSHG